MKPFRQTCFYCLHTPYTPAAKVINGILAFFIVISIGVLPIYFVNSLGWMEEYKAPLEFLEKLTVTIFSIEYILRIYSAQRPWRYIFSWWGIIDLVAILPFYLSLIIPIAHPEVFMMLRILRILKLAKISELDHAHLITQCKNRGHGHFIPLEDEHIEKVVQKHNFILVLALVLPLSLTSLGLITLLVSKSNIWGLSIGILLLALAATFFAKAWLDYIFDVIYITDQRIMIQNRQLFGTISNDISYESITNVIPNNSGLLQWMLGFGDVHIQTASGTTPLFENAPRPDKIVGHIIKNRQKNLDKIRREHPLPPSTQPTP